MKASKKKAVDVLTSSHMRKKHVFYSKENQRIFCFISLLVLFIASLIISLIMVPFLIFFEGSAIYALVFGIALVFGFIFSFMILDLQHLEQKHHVLLGIIIPLIAVLNIFIMMSLAKNVADFFLIELSHNALMVSTFYLIGFVLPYLFFGLVEHRKHV